MRPHSRRACALRGFTLVELLVALAVMALMSVLAWRGLDAMSRATAYTQQRADALMVLQTGMAQWVVDLDAMVDPPQSDPAKPDPSAPAALDWNGQVLRLTRTDPGGAQAGLRVVAWGRREVQGVPHWLRWQSQPIRDPFTWRAAWAQAALWGQNPGDAERRQELAGGSAGGSADLLLSQRRLEQPTFQCGKRSGHPRCGAPGPDPAGWRRAGWQADP